MGILCAGGVSSGIYPTNSAVQVEYLINDSRTRVIFAEDEEQLDKILSCRARCPTLQTHRRVRHGGPERLFRSHGDVARRVHGARAQSHAGPRGAVGRNARKPRRRRSRHPGLHLRHDRAAQGRDAFQPQRHPPDAPRQRPVSLDRRRRAAGVPAALPCRRAGRRLLHCRWRWDR